MESIIQTAVPIASNSLTPIRVLYVDDEISFLKVTKQCLETEEECLQVDIVPSVEEAQKKIKEASYDTIVSDYLMPSKNGLEFLKELRADGNNIPFIVFTGKGREEVAIKALNYGADRYISKSGNPQTVYYELAHGIRQVVRRRRAEKQTIESQEKLRESEKRFRSIVENSFGGIGIVNDNFEIQYVNDQVTKILGYSKKEMIGQDFRRFLHGDAKSLIENRYLRRQNGRSVPNHYEFKVIRKDGKRITVEMKVTLIKNDHGGMQTIAEVIDITDRKEKEREINISQEKFQRLFMGNPEAAVFADTNFRILEINPRFNELFGFSIDEVKGKYINDLVVPKEKMEEAKWLNRNSKKGYFYHSSERKRKDGILIPVAISAAPIIVEKKLCGHVALYKDISKLKQTEKALKDVGEKLRVVGGLTRHDVRNKLSVIAGNNYLAKKKLSHDEEVLEYFNDSELAIRQIEDIFEFARTYEQLGVEELDYTNVEKSFEEAISLVSDIGAIKIKSNCKGLEVVADSLLRYLFYNLIDNSIKHGDKISEIKLYYKDTGTKLKLVYEDDGIGIPNTEKKKIFCEGYGTDTGYGLFLIKKICEVYGWNIKETGKHGKDARFTMAIPKLANNSALVKKNYRL